MVIIPSSTEKKKQLFILIPEDEHQNLLEERFRRLENTRPENMMEKLHEYLNCDIVQAE